MAGEGDAAVRGEEAPPQSAGAVPRVSASGRALHADPSGGARALAWLIALLVAKRIAYHVAFFAGDPFALVTFSDGQIYELAARDILAHPPLGSQPFYLQGLYAYALALPMAIAAQPVVGLLLQLLLAAGAWWLFYRTAVRELGHVAGALSTCVLLALPELAFYENKYLSVSLGVSCNVFALWACCRALRELRPSAIVLAGFAAGLSALGRPNMLLAAPFAAAALWSVARSSVGAAPALRGGASVRTVRVLPAYAIGVLLALGPMALRNQVVLGSADVFPSHVGAIPFYIGNNPHANGLWNTAGGLITGQVALEREQLAAQLGLHAETSLQLDHQVARALTARALQFIAQQPLTWLGLEARKLWYTVGNHRFVRDYDVRGENELIGGVHQFGLPFGVVLALGCIGSAALIRRARQAGDQRARQFGVLLVLGGQVLAVSIANLLVFTSAQNRVPLAMPLAFVSGPALLAIWARVRGSRAYGFDVAPAALVIGALALAQAFWPRIGSTDRPSSVHYYNLASVEEELGRLPAAAAHYALAAQRNPQPMFLLREAHALRLSGRAAEAQAALDRLQALPDVPQALRAAAQAERRALAQGVGGGPAR